MRKIKLKHILRAFVIIWIINIAFQIYSGVHQQINKVTSDYSSIDPLRGPDSPRIYLFEGWVILNSNIISEPALVRKLAIRGSIIRGVTWFLNRILVVLVLFNIFQLLKTWNFSHLFLQENAKVIRRIAWLYLGWVVIYFLIYHSAPFLFPHEYIHSYNGGSLLHIAFQDGGLTDAYYIFRGIWESINDEALLVFFLLFILSIIMKKGTELQKEADLTI